MSKGFRIFLIVTIIFLAGCSRSKVFDRIRDLPDRHWPKDQPVDFQFEISDTHPGYDLSYNVRNSILYKYYNLYLNCTLEDTLGNVLETKLSDFNLFDPKTGKPLGDGLGDLFDHQFEFLHDYHFNNPGIYRLHIKQYMREDTLSEIMSVGLVIRKNKEANP